ncbi:MAG TPA: hypothetical protein VFP86_07840 [bacterium]|nr:hypothetical protein [bacterium]
MTRVLGGLTSTQAFAVRLGVPYTIAQIVAHMLANMRFNLELIYAQDPACVEKPGELWPEVAADEWPVLSDEFIATLEALKHIAKTDDLDRIVHPTTANEPAWTVGYKLACSVAKHNAYHLGQIVALRRLIGAWRDPAGPAR